MISQNQNRWHTHTHTWTVHSAEVFEVKNSAFYYLHLHHSTSIFYSSTTLCSCMFTLFMWPFCPNFQDPKAPTAPIYAAELRSTARGQPNFRPSAADSARTDPSLPQKSHSTSQHCIPHGVDSSIVFLWMIWSSGAIWCH